MTASILSQVAAMPLPEPTPTTTYIGFGRTVPKLTGPMFTADQMQAARREAAELVLADLAKGEPCEHIRSSGGSSWCALAQSSPVNAEMLAALKDCVAALGALQLSMAHKLDVLAAAGAAIASAEAAKVAT